jgi:hypothetical protein
MFLLGNCKLQTLLSLLLLLLLQSAKTKVYLRAKVRYGRPTPPHQDQRFTLDSSAYASDERGNVDSQASASGAQTIAFRGSQCSDFGANSGRKV